MKNLYYKYHIFICTNQKIEGKCCGNEQIVFDLVKQLKSYLRDLNFTGCGGVRVSTSGCMGRCMEGPIAVIYPEGQWYRINIDEEKEAFFKFIRESTR